MPSSVALAQVREITRFTLFTLLAVLFISVVVALLFARGIVTPIEKVHYAFQQFARGRLKYRVAVKTNDEIEDLANGFNEMAKGLQKSIYDLKKERRIISAEKNKLTSVLAGITDAIIAVDLNKNIIIFNQAAVSMTGFSEWQAMGKSIDHIITLLDDKKKLSVSQYCPIKSEETPGVTFSQDGLEMCGFGKRERYVNLVTGQIKGGKSINLGCIVTLHDVTKERLVEKMKSEFVSIAAHQLRTPLSIIKWSLRMFMDEAGKADMSETLKDLLGKAYSTNERMIRLVADLLDAARIEEGRFVYKPTFVDIQEIIESVLGAHEIVFKRKHLKIKFVKPKEKLPKIEIDTDAVKLAIDNLVENSHKYTLPGGSIEISLRGTDSDIEVSVKDNGIGIPRDDKERVFTKFFRAANAVRLETEGSGLGLFIVKNIVEAHDGKIWFESEEGKGSIFSLTLPNNKKM